MEQKDLMDGVFDLGKWLGRKQAFGVVGQRCSAAEAECLLEIHDKKMYLTVEDNWESFCENRLGVSRAHADKILRIYRNLGPGYYKLNSFTPIRPTEYRRIAAAVTDEGLSYGGETISLDAENGPRLAEAVQAFREEFASQAPEIPPADQAFAKAERSLKAALAEFQRLQAMPLDEDCRLKLVIAVETGRDELEKIRLSTDL
jgi:hypothetical protein